MARITTNTTSTQPVIVIKVGERNTNSATPISAETTGLTIPFLQDLTITNSTGVYSYTTFTDIDTRKLSTPADNEISTNIVIDDTVYFGDATATAATAARLGLATLSTDKYPIVFTIYWTGNTSATTDRITVGQGFISSLAPTTSPDAPIWVTPMTIAVDGAMATTVTG
jgi:hypothetical protein